MLTGGIRKTVATTLVVFTGLFQVNVANAAVASAVQDPRLVHHAPQGNNAVDSPGTEVKPYGIKGFLIKKALRVVSSMLRNGQVREVVESARKRGFIDDDMARVISSRPN